MSNQDLSDLQKKIEAVRSSKTEKSADKVVKEQNDDNVRQGMQIGVEFVASILLGGVGGYWLDRWLDTSPAFFLILFLLGIILGFYNIWRITQNLDGSVGFSQLQSDGKDATTAPTENNSADDTVVNITNKEE